MRASEFRYFAYGLISALCSARAGGQTVRGVVSDSASREPVSGAVVTLLDSAGGLASRTITSTTGRFALPVVGHVRALRVIRIGYRPRTISMSITYPAVDTTVAIALAGLPTLLDPVEIVDATNCTPRRDRAAAFALWEQARAGLLATVVGREANPGIIEAIMFDRAIRITGNSLTVVSQTLHREMFESNRPFVAARRAGEFAERGYIDEDSRGRTYYGPDADGLLDPEFAATHCFTLAEDRDHHSGQLGLAFEPSRRDTVADIAGILWIDAATPALNSLEFRYVGVDREAERAGIGGMLSFRTASNGISLIDRWSIRLPRTPRGFTHIDDGFRGMRVVDLHDTGAQIETARWPDGTEWRATTSVVRGQVVHDQDKTPVSNALVWIVGTDDSTRTTRDGSFAIGRLLAGPYDVFAADSVGAHYSFRMRGETHVDIDSARTPSLRIELPDLTRAIDRFCDGRPRANGSLVLIGAVVSSDGTPAPEARVDLEWRPNQRGHQRIEAAAGTDGRVIMCGVAANTLVSVGVRRNSDSERFISTSEFDTGAPIETVQFTIPAPVAGYRHRTVSVIDVETGAPVGGVSIVDDWTGRVLALTDVQGRATLAALPVGKVNLSTRRQGYHPRVFSVIVAPTDTTLVTLPIAKARMP